MRERRLVRTAAGLAVTAILACVPALSTARADRDGPYAPYENLVEVLADFSRHLRDDLYRFPPPKDLVGRNLFAVTLERVENFHTLYPDRMPDVVAFAKAEALVRLGNYAAAGRAFERVASPDSPLAETARERLALVTEIARVSGLPEEGADLESTLGLCRAKLGEWDHAIERARGTPYEPIARLEEERLEQRLVSLVIENRAHLDDGAETALRSATFVITKHAESKNAPAHVIRLGDLYADLAREYAAEHGGDRFVEGVFNQRVDQALQVYQRIAGLDGVPEKLEAQGKFAALEAYRTKVLTSR
jgi:tetratricopeptide (TPR) repeat protein